MWIEEFKAALEETFRYELSILEMYSNQLRKSHVVSLKSYDIHSNYICLVTKRNHTF